MLSASASTLRPGLGDLPWIAHARGWQSALRLRSGWEDLRRQQNPRKESGPHHFDPRGPPGRGCRFACFAAWEVVSVWFDLELSSSSPLTSERIATSSNTQQGSLWAISLQTPGQEWCDSNLACRRHHATGSHPGKSASFVHRITSAAVHPMTWLTSERVQTPDELLPDQCHSQAQPACAPTQGGDLSLCFQCDPRRSPSFCPPPSCALPLLRFARVSVFVAIFLLSDISLILPAPIARLG